MSQIREHWSSNLGFLMAALGSVVGLGLLWKFPYVVGENGGGVFLIIYFVCLFVIGAPIFIAELILGRSTQRAAINAFSASSHPESQWVLGGYLGVLASFLIMSFYSVIAGWGMSYILMSLTGFYTSSDTVDSIKTYNEISQSGPISVFWHFFFTLFTTVIVLSGVRKGIEKWAKIMTKLLLVLLVALFFYAATLKGFSKAAHFIFYPDMSTFTLSSAIEALGLAFWTLSVGQGIMISYGSYMKPSTSVVKMCAIVVMSVSVVAVLASLTIFPVVFTFDLKAQSGPGLIFQTLPNLFARLPGSIILSSAFFSLFVFTALTSAIPLIEVVATNLMELRGIGRRKAAIYVGCATFIFGIPSAYTFTDTIFPSWNIIYGMYFLKTIDTLVSTWIIPLAGLLTALFVGYKMKRKILLGEFTDNGKYNTLFLIWIFFLRYIIPLTTLIIIVQKSGLYDFDKI